MAKLKYDRNDIKLRTIDSKYQRNGRLSESSDVDKVLDKVYDELELLATPTPGQKIRQGYWDASTGVFPDGAGVIEGFYWDISVAGTIDGVEFDEGDALVAVVDEPGTSYIGNWKKDDNIDQVTSVNGKEGDVVLDKDDIGLSNVDNTSDANKPLSTADIAEHKKFEYEVVYVEVEEVFQKFRFASNITGILTDNVATLEYDKNETGSFTAMTIDGGGTVTSGLPLALAAGDNITWRITYESGKDKASLNIIGSKV